MVAARAALAVIPVPPRRRPTGRRHSTRTGTDAVSGAVSDAERGSARPLELAADPSPGDETPGAGPPARSVGDDVLDERESRQSASRKAPGPRRRRVTPDDVETRPAAPGAAPPPVDPL